MWDEMFNKTLGMCGFGGRVSATEGKKVDDRVEAFTRAFLTIGNEKMLKIDANKVRFGDHIHLGVDTGKPFVVIGTGDVWMDSRAIRGLGSSIELNATSGNIGTLTTKGEVYRECPPNKVVKYTQRIWSAKVAVRDNLAVMKVNDFYQILAKSTTGGYLSNSSVSTMIEIWFEDDCQFHVYENDVRVFQSNSAKATAKFLEVGEK